MTNETGRPATGGIRVQRETGDAAGARAPLREGAAARRTAAVARGDAAPGRRLAAASDDAPVAPGRADAPDAAVPGIEAFAPVRRSPLTGLVGTVISLALLAAVGREIWGMNLAHVEGMVPRRPQFWLVFVGAWLLGPSTEWIIYRRLWRLPLSGLAALMRKMVSNELLLGYLGEVQFYAWVRSRLNTVAAPFGAIKDVTILSALTGNLATLLMLVPVWPLIAGGRLGAAMPRVVLALGIVLVTSFVILLLRRRLFTLPPRLLWWIAAVHMGRIAAVVGATALLWHIVLPGVEIGLWLALATVRMLLSRLPLLPNKDVMFAGLAVFLLGRNADIADLMTMMAGLQLAMHVAVGGTLALADIVTTRVGTR